MWSPTSRLPLSRGSRASSFVGQAPHDGTSRTTFRNACQAGDWPTELDASQPEPRVVVALRWGQFDDDASSADDHQPRQADPSHAAEFGVP
jgi:hypothetical protein